MPADSLAEDDFQYWSRYTIKPIDTKYFDYVSFFDFRAFGDASDIGLWLTSQKLIYAPASFLTLGVNYTYLESERATLPGNNEWKYQHRLELEINPKWKWKAVTFKNRNRIEFRWIEDKGSDHGRYRQRWGVDIQLEKLPWIRSFFANEEIFFDFNTHSVNQNRLIPAGLKIPLFKKTTLDFFYMIQSNKRQDDWSANQILGTQVNLAL